MIRPGNILGMLAFRAHALRILAARHALAGGAVCFAAGFLAYAWVRNSVYYALLPEPLARASGLTGILLGMVQAILFLLLVYIPAVIVISNAVSGDGIGVSIARQEYRSHASVLLPLWGMLLLIAAPLQWLVPRFLEIGVIEISAGMLFRHVLTLIYTLWAIRQLNYLTWPQALGVFVLSWFTLPIYFIITAFLFALPLLFMIPLIYVAFQWVRGYLASHSSERAFQQHLQALTSNPQDADAHYQLGLIQLQRRNMDAARGYFSKALEIDPKDPDYHYSLGRAFELKNEWAPAREQYEETYRLDPEYRLGDIFREVGKGYVNTGNVEKGIEFLKFFLSKRDSDPQGRYWLAIALQKTGDQEQMRFQLNRIIEQARSNPGFFRKENREWIYRARMMLRDSQLRPRD